MPRIHFNDVAWVIMRREEETVSPVRNGVFDFREHGRNQYSGVGPIPRFHLRARCRRSRDSSSERAALSAAHAALELITGPREDWGPV